MIFNTGYYHPMDRDYEGLGISPKNIGMTTHPAKDALESLKSTIFTGASTVEIGFMGQGKGNRGQGAATPESYGLDEREAMKQMARINEVKLSTHAAINVTGFSGLKENSFSEQAREKNIHEVEKAIDFAADVAEGGPIVVHSGEFPRDVSAAEQGIFEGFPGEAGREGEAPKITHYLVDKKDGRIIDAVREDRVVWRPKVKEWQKDENGNYYVDKETGEKLYPIYEVYEKDDGRHRKGDIVVEPWTWQKVKYEEHQKNPKVSDEEVAKKFFQIQQEAKMQHSLGQAKEYEMNFQRAVETTDKVMKKINFYTQLKKDFPKAELWRLNQVARDRDPEIPENMDPVDYYKKQLDQAHRLMEYGKEVALASRKEAEEVRELVNTRVESMKDYALDKTADSLARLARFAVKQEKEKGLKKPLFIAPENIFPEYGYGSHPDELKDIIIKSRKKFVEKYEKEFGKDEAKRLADSHLKATFDLGHAWTWRKFFKEKPGETREDTNKRFHKWIMEKVEDMAEKGVVGHFHLTDGFGWDDEHLAPGQGVWSKERLNAFFERMKKKGLEIGEDVRIIFEGGGVPGGESWKGMVGAWDIFGSPIYGAERGLTWGKFDSGYFGNVNAPTYIFGDYAPSNEFRGAPFWSGLGLE